MKKGVEVNEMTSGNVTIIPADKISDIDVKNPVTKKRLCIGAVGVCRLIHGSKRHLEGIAGNGNILRHFIDNLHPE